MSEEYSPPPGPPPAYRRTQSGVDQRQPQQERHSASPQQTSWNSAGGESSPRLGSNNPYRDAHLEVPQTPRPSSINPPNTQSRNHEQYQAPPGPPPGHQNNDTEMSELGDDESEYQPPLGMPPGHERSPHGDLTPSPNLTPTPSSNGAEPPPPEYDPWTGAEDNLRPPPSFAAALPQNTRSPAANADYDDARRAHTWCRETPLWPAQNLPGALVERIQAGDLRLTVPSNTTEVTQYQPSLGRSYVRTSSIGDTILLSDMPIYASHAESPLATGQPKTIYFEVQVMGMGDRYGTGKEVESGIAIGFTAPPYPAWRLPGWHRGSLAVHGDDGRRYVDNSYGGLDFVSAFKKGDTVGIGMSFKPPVHGDRVSMRCEVFFTRNGKKEGVWDLHEEQAAEGETGDIGGLEGEHDILAAVGVFGSTEFETVFREEEWSFKG